MATIQFHLKLITVKVVWGMVLHGSLRLIPKLWLSSCINIISPPFDTEPIGAIHDFFHLLTWRGLHFFATVLYACGQGLSRISELDFILVVCRCNLIYFERCQRLLPIPYNHQPHSPWQWEWAFYWCAYLLREAPMKASQTLALRFAPSEFELRYKCTLSLSGNFIATHSGN